MSETLAEAQRHVTQAEAHLIMARYLYRRAKREAQALQVEKWAHIIDAWIAKEMRASEENAS